MWVGIVDPLSACVYMHVYCQCVIICVGGYLCTYQEIVCTHVFICVYAYMPLYILQTAIALWGLPTRHAATKYAKQNIHTKYW